MWRHFMAKDSCQLRGRCFACPGVLLVSSTLSWTSDEGEPPHCPPTEEYERRSTLVGSLIGYKQGAFKNRLQGT